MARNHQYIPPPTQVGLQHGVEVWVCPFDVTQYDRTHALSSPEHVAIQELVSERDRKGRLYYSRHAIPQRLLAPLQELMRIVGCDAEKQHGVLRVMVTEMHRRQTSFWAWTQEEWSDILGANTSAFMRMYPEISRHRPPLLAIAYLLGNLTDIFALGQMDSTILARKVFGRNCVDAALRQMVVGAHRWGFSDATAAKLATPLCIAFLANQSPRLEDVSLATLNELLQHASGRNQHKVVVHLSQVLLGMQVLPHALSAVSVRSGSKPESERAQPSNKDGSRPLEAVQASASEWDTWCQRWLATSTLTPQTRKNDYNKLLQVGRWLAKEHPDKLSPAQWNRAFAAVFLAAVDRLHVGDWTDPGVMNRISPDKLGKPLKPRAKADLIGNVRRFFVDCLEWGWLTFSFDPRRYLAVPRSIQSLIGPDPRVIADDIWAKLLWAGLNLTIDDLPTLTRVVAEPTQAAQRWVIYPLEMVRAMALVWLFAGLRSDEWSRLRLGCIRWQRRVEEMSQEQNGEKSDSQSDTCLLAIPVHKTGDAFTKPVDRVVGEAISLWEQARVTQSPRLDRKTNEMVHFLFCYRDRRVSKDYINQILIPMLCRKAGVPLRDARGNITSHRARSTIATQLLNAEEPMSLFELQAWLGHRHIQSTQQYAQISPTRLNKAHKSAAYFVRNLRLIDVLIDQDAVKSGAAAQGVPWRFYDLGHGLCMYDFFDQCPHRMACAKCAFYVPKGSTLEQILEGKSNLLRLRQEIPLTDEELAAVDDGYTALETLREKLMDVPTPTGLTPRQLVADQKLPNFVPLQSVHSRSQQASTT